MKVSIVTISYNQAQFLDEAIRSVLNQTYPSIEYLILDGGSNDGSTDIIKEYADRVTYRDSGPDRGAAAALNKGFALATGQIYAYLNSDDCLLPHAVETWVDYFHSHPQADLVYGDIELIDACGKPTMLPGKRVSVFKATSPAGHRRMAAGGFPIPQQTCAWRRRAHEIVGGFESTNRTCWDGEYFADAAIAGMEFHKSNMCSRDSEFTTNRLAGPTSIRRLACGTMRGSRRSGDRRLSISFLLYLVTYMQESASTWHAIPVRGRMKQPQPGKTRPALRMIQQSA